MLIDTFYNGVEIHREEKIIYAKFLLPHQVLSTFRAAGGLRAGLEYVYNHQSCEPAGHSKRIRTPGGIRWPIDREFAGSAGFRPKPAPAWARSPICEMPAFKPRLFGISA